MNRILKIYIILCFYTGFIVTLFPSSFFNILADVVFVGLLLFCAISKLQRKLIFPFISLLSVSILTLSCFWSSVNDNDASTILLNLRQYKNIVLFLPLAYAAASNFSFFIDVYKYSLWASVPISVLQYITVDKSLPAFADHVVGVFGFGQSGTLSLLIIVYVVFEFLRRERKNQKLFDWYLFLLLPMLLNETKIVFAILPIVFIVSYLIFSRQKINVIRLLPLFFAGFFLADASYRAIYNVSIINFFNSEFIEEYFFVDQIHASQEIDIGRFKRVEYALNYIERLDDSNYYFGLGLGSSFVGSDSGQVGQGAKEFYEIGLHTGSRIQMYYSVLDFGVVGSVIFLTVILFLFVHAALLKIDSESKMLAVPASFVFLFSLFYQAPFSSNVFSLILFFSYYTLLFDYNQKTNLMTTAGVTRKLRFLLR